MIKIKIFMIFNCNENSSLALFDYYLKLFHFIDFSKQF